MTPAAVFGFLVGLISTAIYGFLFDASGVSAINAAMTATFFAALIWLNRTI